MKFVKSIVFIFVLLLNVNLLCSCSSNEVVGPQGEKGEQGIQGEPGKDGTSLLNGHGEPTNELGKNGDSYIDLVSWNYYVKSSDIWTLEGNIKGEDGKDFESDYEGSDGLIFYPINDERCAVSIGNAKFLTEVVIPSKYLHYDVTVVYSLTDFPAITEYNDYIEKIILPDSIVNIYQTAFSGLINLKSITIPSSVKRIGHYAFEDCSSLSSIVIPSNVMVISAEVFSGCRSLSIYCEAAEQPEGWATNWNPDNRPVYWAGQWEYDSEGNPVPLS